jgi:hypothetical protein
MLWALSRVRIQICPDPDQVPEKYFNGPSKSSAKTHKGFRFILIGIDRL